jgi:hypothetical protein
MVEDENAGWNGTANGMPPPFARPYARPRAEPMPMVESQNAELRRQWNPQFCCIATSS